MNHLLINADKYSSTFGDTTFEYSIKEVKPYSNKELAGFYGISCKIFGRWLQPFADEIGIKTGRYYTVKQVQVIFEKLGLPFKLT